MKSTFFAVVLAILFWFATAKVRKIFVPDVFWLALNAVQVLKKTFSTGLLFAVCVKFGYFARSFTAAEKGGLEPKRTELKKNNGNIC